MPNKIGKCIECGDYWVELVDGEHCEKCKEESIKKHERAARMTTAAEVYDEA